MIGIRADANEVIGMGHLMRCISIAQAVREQGETCIFFTCENNLAAELLEEYRFPYCFIRESYDEKEKELYTLQREIEKRDIRVVLLDSYEVTEEYLKRLHQMVKLVYMDDLNSFLYDVDGVVNYSLHASEALYAPFGYSGTDFLLGHKYIPLRKEFCGGDFRRNSGKVRNIMLTTGGTDPFGITAGVLQGWNFEKFGDVTFHVVAGQYFDGEYRNKLRELAENRENVILYENLFQLSGVMERCDAAFSAGGTTVLELCAMGVAVVGMAFADNQSAVFGYAKEGMIAGAVDILQEDGLKKARDIMEKLIEDLEYFKRVQERARTFVDGKGAGRLADYLIKTHIQSCI